ncbi:hypothetical protein LCGC14_0251690 [marine sediment metagenome]|uniref:Terminase large subunit gp17-like C-terminal domain-containing protein n=1 Tax=marine sediment metagenome TaxID=412755 RepID=A0A0F9UKY4_9ZZZZ
MTDLPLDYIGESDEDPYVTTLPENLPSKPVEPTKELRESMRKMGRDNLYYLCKVILGYSKLVPHVHMPMCEFADTVKSRRRLKLMPRTHYKTTIWTIALTIKDILNDPNITILIVADTGTNASRFMREIQQHFQMNELFRWLYSEIIPKNFTKATWSQTEMIVPRTQVRREPTVDAIGAGGGVESRHYDVIRPDDLVTEKCIRSAVEMEALNVWAGGLESLLNSEIEGLIDFTGSRKQKGDLYEVQMKRYGDGFETQELGPHATQIGEMAVFWRRDIENGKPIFPEQNSMAFLMRMKKWDPQRYHAQYANSPKGTGLNTYDSEDLRYWRWSPDGNHIICAHKGEMFLRMSPWAGERIILYDPAQAKKVGNSQNAILVLLRGYPLPFRIVLEAHIGHYPAEEAIQLLFDLDKKWNPSFISVEYRGFQGAIKNWVHEKAEREEISVPPMILWPPEGSPKAQWAKDQHIQAVQPLTRTNLVWLHENQIELVEQFEFHPNVRWDDGVDCFSQSLDYWPAMMSEAEHMEGIQTERDYIEENIGIIPLFRDSDMKEKAWDEMAYLSQLNATGYRQHMGR